MMVTVRETILAKLFNESFCCGGQTIEPLFIKEEVVDPDAINLSHVGQAVYDCLRKEHGLHHNKVWDVSSGRVIGTFHQTPRLNEKVDEGHSDWLPEKMCEIMSRTKHWCDILSLVPPDGLFLENFKKALQTIDLLARELDEIGRKKPPVIVRVLFGNLIGLPVNCDAVIKELTNDLPENSNTHVWVGAWRRRLSWNHAKIIAVDGRYLHTGGHNLMDKHYLRDNPVHDLSLEMEGMITHNAHTFANFHWDFIKRKQDNFFGWIAEKIPDNLPLAWKTRVIISEYPEGTAYEFPPSYIDSCVPYYDELEGTYPVIGVGRLGAIAKVVHKILRKDRPADCAFLAMINSSTKSIKMVVQDFGPVSFPGTKIPLPGLIWPEPYLTAIAHAIWRRGVVVNIILSNAGSTPSNLGLADGTYGNGWSCVDVAAEIVKLIRKNYSGVKADSLREKVTRNLRICFIRREKGKTTYDSKKSIGLHSKHFIIDDTCFYIGSQNLYYCDLAEWGVIIDNAAKTKDVLAEYWNPLWSTSYTPYDCDMNLVMRSITIDREYSKDKIKDRQISSRTMAGLHRGYSTYDPSFYSDE